MLKIQSV